MPFVAWLEAQVDEGGDEPPGETTVAAFRLETASAIVRFIDEQLDRSLVAVGTSARGSRAAPDGRPGKREVAYFVFGAFWQLGIRTSVGARNTVITAPPET